MREILFALATVLSLAATPALAQAPLKPPPAAPGPGQADVLAMTLDDRVLGNRDAPITIIEYGSLTCPHCAAFAADVLPKLTQKWIDSGKAKLVFRVFARDDADLHAATIAACAPPDRYFPFIDALFASQQQWVLASDYKAALARMALLGGMNKAKFDACYDDKSVQDKILADRLAASKDLGVDSTPTFFINGKKLEGGPTEASFDTALSKLTGS
jgi:protein-disulfide isomerase